MVKNLEKPKILKLDGYSSLKDGMGQNRRQSFLFRPWLFLPAEWSHFLSPAGLKLFRMAKGKGPIRWRSFKWRGIEFLNPLGTAGGVDKNALHIDDWQALGAGFIEIGTVTFQPQKAHPGPILKRSLSGQALWNRMGFPNKGAFFVQKRLSQSQRRQAPLFINIGKNRQTPLSQAEEDYKKVIQALYPFASAFVINISSPNTKNLKDLLKKQRLSIFLRSLKKFAERFGKTPLILKVSPDEAHLIQVIEQSLEEGIDGWCIANSTSRRPAPDGFPKQGGVSGKPLTQRSLNLLKEVKKYLAQQGVSDKLLISCGGVFTPQDVLERLQAGAHLVQVYSALVFEGPGFFQSLFKKLSAKAP